MPRKTKMTKITSPEKTEQINKSNLRLMEDFLMYLQSVQRSPGTINGYRSDLMIVFTFILDNLGNKDFHKLTKRDIVSLQNWMVANGNSSSRVRRVKSAISSLSNYIEAILSDDEPEYSGYRPIVRKIENPPLQPVREKTVWQEDDLESLLKTLTDMAEHEKACAVALALYSGRRKAELCRMKTNYFTDDNLVCDGALYKTSEPVKTKGAGLGKYIFCYTLAKGFKPYLDVWMDERQALGIESEWLLFDPDKPEEPINISTLNSWANTFSRLTGQDFYWHSLRHAFTTKLAKAGIPDGVIAEIVGWSDVSLVAVYNDSTADEQIGMYFKDGDICVDEKKSIVEI